MCFDKYRILAYKCLNNTKFFVRDPILINNCKDISGSDTEHGRYNTVSYKRDRGRS